MNAARKAQGLSPMVLGRNEAMTGVLIDDLITSGATEPYRMFTSRSEFRLILRAENSDFRLTPKGVEYGLISEEQIEAFEARKREKAKAQEFASTFALPSAKWHSLGVSSASASKTENLTIETILSHTGVTMDQVKSAWQKHQAQLDPASNANFGISPLVSNHITIESQYAHYISKQQRRVHQMSTTDWDNLDISTVNLNKLKKILSNEDYERLATNKPQTLNAAKRLGIKQAALAIIYN